MDEDEIHELVNTKKMLYARYIFEVQGRPKHHVKESLEKLISALKKEDGVIISDEKYEDIIELEDNIFSYLVDVGVIAKDFETMINITLRYGPSVVYFIEPEKITIDMRQMQNVLSDIGRVIQEISMENIKLKLKMEGIMRGVKTRKS